MTKNSVTIDRRNGKLLDEVTRSWYCLDSKERKTKISYEITFSGCMYPAWKFSSKTAAEILMTRKDKEPRSVRLLSDPTEGGRYGCE